MARRRRRIGGRLLVRDRYASRKDLAGYADLIATPADLGRVRSDTENPLTLPANGRLGISCSEHLDLGAILVYIGPTRIFSHSELDAETLAKGVYGEKDQVVTLAVPDTAVEGELSLWLIDDFGAVYLIAGALLNNTGIFEDTMAGAGVATVSSSGRLIKHGAVSMKGVASAVTAGGHVISHGAASAEGVAGATAAGHVVTHGTASAEGVAGAGATGTVTSGGGTPGTMFLFGLQTGGTAYQLSMSNVKDVTTITDSGKVAYMGMTSIQGMTFKDDGFKAYVFTGAVVHQFTLGTAYDVTTRTYDGWVGLNEKASNVFDVSFKSDGTKMYILGSSSAVFQYALSTPWDVRTALFDPGKNVSLSATATSANGMAIKADGAKLYLTTTTGTKVVQYSMSTPWDISTAVADSVTFNFSTQDSVPQAVFFKPDGTKMYMGGTTNKKIYQYSLGTPWDVSTATYDTKSLTTSGQDASTLLGFWMKSDGTKLWFVGTTTNVSGYRYTLSTPWDISTATYDTVSWLHTFVGGGGIFFNATKSKMYTAVFGSTSKIYEHTLSTPGDLSTALPSGNSFSFSAQTTSGQDFFMTADGTKIFVYATTGTKVYKFILGTPFDLTTATFTVTPFSTNAQDTAPKGVAIKQDDGLSMYVLGGTNKTVYQYTLGTAWNTTTATYATKSFSVNAQDTAPTDLFFKADGTKMYIVGDTNNTLYQYSLATPWDVSTASYDTKSLAVGTQDGNPSGVFIKSDGTKVYVMGDANNTVYQYTLSTPWDLSTGTYDTKSLSVSTQQGTPTGVHLKADGSKLYATGTSGVHQYTLATPYDVSTGSYDSIAIATTNNDDTAPSGIFFNPDGSSMHLMGATNKTVYDYPLDSAWDLSRAVLRANLYTAASLQNFVPAFSLPIQESTPTSIYFKDDGTEMYLLGTQSGCLNQFHLGTAYDFSTCHIVSKTSVFPAGTVADIAFNDDGSKAYALSTGSAPCRLYQFALGTPWDFSTAKFAGKAYGPLDVQNANMTGVAFKPDGLKVYITSASTSTVYQYSLSSAWDVGTMSYASKSVSLNTQDSSIQGIAFKSDGTKLYAVGQTNDNMYQYTLSTPWDISTATYDTVAYSILNHSRFSNNETLSTGMFMKSDGSKMFVAGGTNNMVFQYDLNTPYDVSTMTNQMYFPAEDSAPSGLFFNNDGTKMYMVGDTNNTVYQYTLSSAYDPRTATYASKSLSVAAQDTQPGGGSFNNDGTLMYIVGGQNDKVYQYALVTPYDISTATYSTLFISVTAQDTNPFDVFFKSDGTQMFVIGATNKKVYRYTLSVAWSVSTATYDSLASPAIAQDSTPAGVALKSDGSKMYVAGRGNGAVYQYTLSTPYDPSTATYDTVQTVAKATGNSTDGIAFSSDGTKLAVTSNNSPSAIAYYALGSAWDLSTAVTPTKIKDVSAQSSAMKGLYFKDDGLKMYVADSGTASCYQYTLSTAWDVSTASYDTVTKKLTGTKNTQGIYISSDGLTLYAMQNLIEAAAGVETFTLGSAWNAAVLTPDNKYFVLATQSGSTGALANPHDSGPLNILIS